MTDLIQHSVPTKQGLYDPYYEHDACGTGFVANIKGIASHDLVVQGLTILDNLAHRGATGSESETGDGAGVLIQIPHKFLRRECATLGFNLPDPRYYGVGMLFLPREETVRIDQEKTLERIIEEEGQHVLGWRSLPTDDSSLGATAKATQPLMRQIFIERSPLIKDRMSFERKLFVIRKRAEREIRYSDNQARDQFYVCSMSYKTLVYKGMLTPKQVGGYFPDLADADLETALVVVHSRFSTNTFPSWDRAHPYRLLAHNGEINTLRGNVNWLNSQQSKFH